MNSFRLALRQTRYENIAFWRNPAAAFFTFIFPLIFLFIFNLVFGNEDVTLPSGDIANESNFYVPAIASLSVVSACYTGIAMSVSFSRDRGILKRIRGTPLPAWAYLFGRIAQSTIIAAILVVIVTVCGVLLFGVDAPTNTIPSLIVSLVIGAVAFAALGLAITGFIPNAEAAPAIVNASVLPLLFISDVFINTSDAPAWLSTLADVFPIRHFSLALHAAFNPFETGAGFQFGHLAVLAVWGIGGALVAIRFFSWEPRR